MLERLLTSKTRLEILKLLLFNPDEQLHLREISRKIKTTPVYVRKELKNLEELNLVTMSKKANLSLFSANKKSPIHTELRNILMKTEYFDGLARKTLEGMQIDYAFIYGSFARGMENKTSDIDLFIIGNLAEDQLADSIRKIEDKTKREVNYMLWSRKEFLQKAGKHHLLREIGRNPIVTLIGDENELRQKLGTMGEDQGG
jgi:predicted nucleotidyltransferase